MEDVRLLMQPQELRKMDLIIQEGGKKKQPDEQSWACFCDVKINMSSSFELFLHVSLKVPLPTPSLYCSSSFVN